MKWGRPALIRDEEPGLGASLERLALASDWFAAAELLELGDPIPFAALDLDQAVRVEKYLAPRSLRLDRDDSHWYVVQTARRGAQKAHRLLAGRYKAVG